MRAVTGCPDRMTCFTHLRNEGTTMLKLSLVLPFSCECQSTEPNE